MRETPVCPTVEEVLYVPFGFTRLELLTSAFIQSS